MSEDSFPCLTCWNRKLDLSSRREGNHSYSEVQAGENKPFSSLGLQLWALSNICCDTQFSKTCQQRGQSTAPILPSLLERAGRWSTTEDKRGPRAEHRNLASAAPAVPPAPPLSYPGMYNVSRKFLFLQEDRGKPCEFWNISDSEPKNKKGGAPAD